MPLIANTLQELKAKLPTGFTQDTLKARVFRGGAWLGAGSLTEQLFRFSRNMLLTRLLAPEAFGAMAIVQSATTLIQTTVEVGAREALIQNPQGGEDSHVNAAWWMTVARSSFVYFLIFVFAPLIARFYGSSELTPLARIVTLSLLFDGLISPRAYSAMKAMKFWKWAAVNNGGGILGVMVTVILGFFLRDVWALAIGFCSENAARCILSYAICPFRLRLPNKEAIRDLLKFSKGLVGLSLLNLLFSRTDIFVLGKLYSPEQLGLYSMAVYLIQTPAVFLVNVMNQTLLPALARVQDDNARLNRILLQVVSATILFGFPATVFVALCGRSLLTLAYGHRYAAGSTALGLACCGALFNVLNNQITVAFYAKGLPQLHRRSVAAMAMVVVLLIYPLARVFGLWGGQLTCLIAVIIGYLLQIERIRGVSGLKISQYRSRFSIPVCASMVVAAPLFLLARYTGILSRPVPSLVLGLTACLVVYGLTGALNLRSASEVA